MGQEWLLNEKRVLVSGCVVSGQIQSSIVSVGMLKSPVSGHQVKDKMLSCPPALCFDTLKGRGSPGSFCGIIRTTHQICQDKPNDSAVSKEQKCNYKFAFSTQGKRKGGSSFLYPSEAYMICTHSESRPHFSWSWPSDVKMGTTSLS